MQTASREQETRMSCDDQHCCNLSLLPQSMDGDNRAHNNWVRIAQAHKSSLWWRFLPSEWQNFQSAFFHTFNLMSLLPYPTNTITGTHILLETSCLTWFSSYVYHSHMQFMPLSLSLSTHMFRCNPLLSRNLEFHQYTNKCIDGTLSVREVIQSPYALEKVTTTTLKTLTQRKGMLIKYLAIVYQS